jgi:hypothetical protein
LIGVEFSLPVHAALHELDVQRRFTLFSVNPLGQKSGRAEQTVRNDAVSGVTEARLVGSRVWQRPGLGWLHQDAVSVELVGGYGAWRIKAKAKKRP